MAAWGSRSLRHSRIPATSFLGAQSKFRRWVLMSSSVPHSRCSGASSNGFGSPRLWSSVRRKSSGQFSRGEQRALSTNLRYRTASGPRSPRDEALWQKALAIQRRAVVIDTHNDVTTPMTNDDYDLGGSPPTPYRTSIERMKKGGLNAEFFSLYIKPWYVAHGGAARRTL